MDERLEAGRHHLLNGDRALQMGFPDDSRAHFEAALLQFRGPELRLGEAHALRGLAQVDLQRGQSAQAEARLSEAIKAYQAIYGQLDRIDVQGVSGELRRDAQEGEATSLVLLGELHVRVGKLEEARASLGYAREIYGNLGDLPSAAAVWAALARLALREGRYDHAEEHFEKALAIHVKSGNLAGQVGIWLSIAELKRVRRDLQGAEEALGKAEPLARRARSPTLEGRVRASLGSLTLQQLRLDEARGHYEAALPLVREAGDTEIEAFVLLGLGDVLGRAGDGAALDFLVDGARILGSLEHHHGLGSAMLRVAEQGLRMGEHDLALAAAEGGRRLYRTSDPVRGVGQALRLVVKSLAGLRSWRAVLLAATTRERIAGAQQPNAGEVAAFYRARAPEDLRSHLEALSPKELLAETEAEIERILRPVMERLGMPGTALDSFSGALSAIEMMAMRLPRPAPPEDWESGSTFDTGVDTFPGVVPEAPHEEPPDEDLPTEVPAPAMVVMPASMVVSVPATPDAPELPPEEAGGAPPAADLARPEPVGAEEEGPDRD